MTDKRLSGRPRSSTMLKTRLLQAHQDEIAAGLAWAASDSSIEAAAARVTAARRRFILGAETSFAYATLLAMKLNVALAKVILIDGTLVSPLDILSDVHDSDVMIALSLSPYHRTTVETATEFAQAGGALVVITDSPTAPLVSWAHEAVVIAPSPQRPEPPDWLHPETPAVSPATMGLLIDILAALCSASAKGGDRRVAERRRLAEKSRHYLGESTPCGPADTGIR